MNARWQIFAVGGLLCSLPVWAQAKSPFYERKQITFIVSTEAGTSYDLYPRIATRHLPRHIPGNPKIIIKNMPGAAGIVAANWLSRVPKRDGLTIGAIHRTLPLAQALGVPQVKFDAARFHWIGTPIQETASCFVRSDSPYKTKEDLVKATKPVRIAATQPRSDVFITPLILNKVLGTRFKIVSGYRFGAAGLAVERGEVDGMCGWGYASLKALKSHWLEKGFIRILLQVGQKKHADLPNVPLASDLVTDPQAKQLLQMWDTQLAVGRPWMTPPGVPEDRVRILRQAFLDVMKDPKFLNDARKAKIEINPLAGDQVQALVQKILATPASVRDFLKEIFKY